jgi:hypothetical protein
VLAGCQLMGSIILFMVLFIIFILIGFTTTVFLIEQVKSPYSVFDKENKIVVGNGKNYEVVNNEN